MMAGEPLNWIEGSTRVEYAEGRESALPLEQVES